MLSYHNGATIRAHWACSFLIDCLECGTDCCQKLLNDCLLSFDNRNCSCDRYGGDDVSDDPNYAVGLAKPLDPSLHLHHSIPVGGAPVLVRRAV